MHPCHSSQRREGVRGIGHLVIYLSHRVVYKSRQPAKFAGFSVRFRRLLSLFEESRHVKEMMFMRSKLLGLNTNKNLQCLSFLKIIIIISRHLYSAFIQCPKALYNNKNQY